MNTIVYITVIHYRKKQIHIMWLYFPQMYINQECVQNLWKNKGVGETKNKSNEILSSLNQKSKENLGKEKCELD